MSGTVNIARSLFDHAVFADEPKTEREAWIWLIMEASWKPRTRRVGAVVVETQRGQLAASVRFLASAWKWTAPKVQRYLKRLEKMEMIRAQADTGVTVITICNYDQYQTGGQASDTAPIQPRYTSDTNEKKEVIREEGKKDANASSRSPAPQPARFDEFWDCYPHRGGTKRKRKEAVAAYLKAMRTGVSEQQIIEGARKAHADPSVQRGFARDPVSWLKQEGWADEIQPTLTVIPGGPRDQSPQPNRQTSASDTLRYQLDVAGRMRRPSSENCF